MQMDRRDFLKLAGAGLCLPAMSGVTEARAAGQSLPNIVLVMADDQGWGEMGYNGHPVIKTPNFDDMAATGLRFDRFYAAHPVCSPTRGSVMTGRNPNRYGCFSWGNTLRPQEVTIAEALRTAGYVTGHFGKWHLGSTQKGSPVNPGASGFDEWLSAPNFFDNNPILSRNGVAVPLEGESSVVTAQAALEFIRRHSDADRPFLAVVWFGSPHNPHEAVEEDKKHYLDQPEELQNFYGEITGMDRAFGMIRSEIGKLGIRGNTILWYCSDNGGLPRIGSTGGRGNKGQIYEGGLRVPAILEWPDRFNRHRETNVPCVTSDFYPTLLEIAGVSIEDQPPLDGVSLASLIDGRMEVRPRPIGFWNFPEGGVPTPAKAWMEELLEDQRRGDMIGDLEKLRLESAVISKQYPEDVFPGHAAWLDWPWKLHRIQDGEGQLRYELYNLKDDPQEVDDLALMQAGRVKEMGEGLLQWQVSVLRSLNGKDYR